MSGEGYIKLSRRALDKGWIKNHKLWAFWCWCLMKASHTEHTAIVGFQHVPLERGQFVFGLNNASDETGLSIQSIRTMLKFLTKVEQNITVKPTNKYSIITIVNYDAYQSNDTSDNNQFNTQLTNKQQTTNKPLTTNKNGNNGKNGKNGKNKILTSWPDDFTLTDHLRELASKYIPSDKIDLEWEAFQAWANSNGKKFADWNAAWKTRYINYRKYQKTSVSSGEDKNLKELL